MNPFPFDHVAIATDSIGRAAPIYELLTGEGCSPVEEIPSQGVNVAFVGCIELLEPRGPQTSVARFLEKRGPGLHHLAFRVPDIARALRRLEAEGFTLIDREARSGARGHRVAFLHPSTTGGVLWELVEADGRATPPSDAALIRTP